LPTLRIETHWQVAQANTKSKITKEYVLRTLKFRLNEKSQQVKRAQKS